MRTGPFKRLFYLILLLFLIQGIGCETTKSMFRKARPEKAGLRKRVLFIPVIDQSKSVEARAAEISDGLVHLLKKDKGLLIHEGMRPMPSKRKTRSLEFGMAMDPDLAKRAEEMGMNVLITGVLNPPEVTTREVGFWPLRRIRHELEISLLVNAIDVINGTLFISNLEMEKIKISNDALEWEEVKKEIDDHKLSKAFSRIIERHASAISRTLREQPWCGRVISSNQETIMVNAGKDIGLTQGTVFDVFGRGEALLCAGGRSLCLLGPKVGQIKTVSIMDSYATAVPLNGGQFEAGQVIRIRD